MFNIIHVSYANGEFNTNVISIIYPAILNFNSTLVINILYSIYVRYLIESILLLLLIIHSLITLVITLVITIDNS